MCPSGRVVDESADPCGAEGLSVKSSFRSRNVLITGATGYVGSLVLEHLLRVCPDVGRVYVLIRGKRNQTAKKRLEILLSGGLFSQLWDFKDILEKVKVVEGDITQDDLGFSNEDREELLSNVNIVIHSAAAVALDDPIKKTLRNNYLSTYRLLELCKQMPHLKSYAHVSTAFVNISHERGSVVKEKIYPLVKGDMVSSHVDITTEIMRLEDEDAQLKADVLMDRFNFPNTYCIGKRLTEELVADYFKKGLPCCIIRPSLITGVDQGSYPGYIGNLAGGAGFAIAFAIGFFQNNSSAWTGNGVCDIVPGNVVSSVVLAAAASTANCRIKDNEIGVFHACTSSSYPISNVEMYKSAHSFFTKEPPPYCLLLGSYPFFPLNYKPNRMLVYLAKMRTAIKVKALSWLLRRMGKDRIAKRLYVGWKAWDFGNQQRYDMNLFFSVDNVRKLDEMLVEEEKSNLQLLFTPVNGNWSRYMRTYLAGIKSLLLKSPVKDNSDHDFRMIAPLDPPLELPNCTERKPSVPLQPQEAVLGKGVPRRTSSCISARALPALGRSMNGHDENISVDGSESEEGESISSAENQRDAVAEIIRIPERTISKKVPAQ